MDRHMQAVKNISVCIRARVGASLLALCACRVDSEAEEAAALLAEGDLDAALPS